MSHPEFIPTDTEREPRMLAEPGPEAPAGETDDVQASSASNGESFGAILSEFEESHRRAAEGQGESRQGTVVAISSEFVFVDIGFKTEGVIPVEEFRDASGNLDVKQGDQLVVSIKGRNADGYYLLSKIKVERPKDWSSLETAFAEKRTIAGVVTGVVKGGLSVDVGVRAFLPASRSGVREAAALEQLVGQEITCKIIKLDVTNEDVVVDRRAVLEEEEARARQEAFDALQEGAVVRGTVRTLTDFGAFIDLGGVDGLLHVSDMSWGRVGKPADVLAVGDSIEVKVLKIDRQSRRISLGTKQLQPDPWSLAAEKYPVGQRVHGKVTRVADFGAFVELEPGVEGLIRLIDLTWSKKAVKPKDVVKPGELVEVVVLNVNAAERRIGLGLKQALGDPWDEAAQKFPAGAIVEGKIVNMAKFGAFVELAEGVEGMIHVGDITAEKRIDHPQDVLKIGQTVRAVVLEFDREKRRIRLGMKQLQPTTADEYIAEHKAGDIVTGRVVAVGKKHAEVELGEGLKALCTLPKETGEPREQAAPASVDVSSLSAMLAAKWKHGKTLNASPSVEPVRQGQVRSFRITGLDPAQKRIELELA
ncbi:MAG TPA: 30S ribosomal protein S1 [Bryobacteraceae bacterium]|mgnify:CR=1 FL=1|nr:30S ribosomal protein S1 [Bryobacteraceae bacterium]HOQ44153.1 30S ribosomal protein S1 [Bryobacteraceae bacterium]HPU70471.1 30S ribosomal protein S1 [Bryobacteraceae bacterium]